MQREKASLTHYSGTANNAIPFTLITAVCPFEANRRLSLQKLRDPFNTGVCATSHHLLLSETPCQCLLFLINVFGYSDVDPIIGGAADLSREYLHFISWLNNNIANTLSGCRRYLENFKRYLLPGEKTVNRQHYD